MNLAGPRVRFGLMMRGLLPLLAALVVLIVVTACGGRKAATPAQRCAAMWNEGRLRVGGRTRQMLQAHPGRFPVAANMYRGSCVIVVFRARCEYCITFDRPIKPIMAASTFVASGFHNPPALEGLRLARKRLPRRLRYPNASLNRSLQITLVSKS